MPDKIDSNITELSFAEESSIGVLPGAPQWYALDPNTYSDFGGETTLLSRTPLTKDRQDRKGVVVDVDAGGGFNNDLTYSNMWRLLQGFMFKQVAEKPTTLPMNSTQITITNVDGTTDDAFDAASGLSVFNAGQLIYAENFTNDANNGLHRVQSSSGTEVATSSTLVDESSPPSNAFFRVVGFEIDVSTCNVVAGSEYPYLDRASGTQDWTDSGIVAGDIVYLGADSASDRFTNSLNNGWGRVSAITASRITFDKFSSSMTNETGTGLTIHIYFGDRINNDTDGENINRTTYNFERTLGNDGSGTQSEYLVGAVPNEMKINISEADKVTMDLAVVAKNHENRDGSTGVKTGTRNALASDEDAYNTSSDVARIKMNIKSATDENPTALFAYVNELSITANNGVTPNKAVGVEGAFDFSTSNFTVGGDLQAYFGDITASNAIKANNDITLDFVIVKDNRGFAVDIPLLSLGDGKNNVVAQEAIKMPLTTSAAKDGTYNYTMSFSRYAYVPTVAG